MQGRRHFKRRTPHLLRLLPLLFAAFVSGASALGAVTELRVMSFNIWVNGGRSLSQCIEAIRTSGADIVGLQECNPATAETIAADLSFHHLGVNDVSIPFTYPRGVQLRATAEFALVTGLIADHLRAAASAA